MYRIDTITILINCFYITALTANVLYYYIIFNFIYVQLPSKTQLMKMIKEAGGLEGDLLVLGIRNIKRAKRLMGLELVRNNNMVSANSK